MLDHSWAPATPVESLRQGPHGCQSLGGGNCDPHEIGVGVFSPLSLYSWSPVICKMILPYSSSFPSVFSFCGFAVKLKRTEKKKAPKKKYHKISKQIEKLTNIKARMPMHSHRNEMKEEFPRNFDY